MKNKTVQNKKMQAVGPVANITPRDENAGVFARVIAHPDFKPTAFLAVGALASWFVVSKLRARLSRKR